MARHQPLVSIKLPGIVKPIADPEFIVVVGPNSAGKTRLQRDIESRLTGRADELVVAEQVVVTVPENGQAFIDELTQYGQISVDLNQPGQYKAEIADQSNNSQIQIINPNQLLSEHANYIPNLGKSKGNPNSFLNTASKFQISALHIDKRSHALNAVQTIDNSITSPNNDLHALHKNTEAQNELVKELRKTFNKFVWPCSIGKTTLTLRVADGVGPPPEDRLDVNKVRDYRDISSEGDGFKSYAAICTQILLGLKAVLLVDEPELCLHPPQARHLGEFVGINSGKFAGWTIIATHSPQFVRGAIQRATSVRIIRLRRVGSEFRAHTVDPKQLSEVASKPIQIAEATLEGLFADCVVIVEADDDRLIYQTAIDQLDLGFAIHFIAAHGSGAVGNLAQTYRDLGVPVLAITDADVLFYNSLLEKIIVSLSESELDPEDAKKAETITAAVVKFRAKSTRGNKSNGLMQLLSKESMSAEEKSQLARQLRKLASYIDPSAKLFPDWLAALDDQLKLDFDSLLEKFQNAGLYIVPVGELENWYPPEVNDSYPAKVKAFEFAKIIRAAGLEKNEKFHKFIVSLGEALKVRVGLR